MTSSTTRNKDLPVPKTVLKVMKRFERNNAPSNNTGYEGIDSDWKYYQPGKTCNHCGRHGFIAPLCPYNVTRKAADQYWMDRVLFRWESLQPSNRPFRTV